jgi:iturin family lipopeptide synthetase A
LGVVGEIYIRTPFRSAGYLDDVQTRNSFMVNPFGNDSRDLLYKTGDLARQLDDCKFEIIGRLDHQVKIRGIRIELDDIRMNILKYPGISDVAVVTKEGEDGEVLLFAYIVSNDVVDVTKLRNYLDQNLPAHMVPSYLIPIDKLPLLQNGKLNRKALPIPQTLEIMGGYVQPITLMEKRLAAIWSEMLSIDAGAISSTKTFFELGGHSVKVFYLINRLQQEFNVKLKLGDVFQFNTIKKQAELVSGLTEVNRTRIDKTPLTGYHVTSPSQKRIFYQYLLDPESISYNIPIFIKINGDVDLDRIKRIFQLLIDRHEALRTSFILNEKGVVQIVNEAATVSVELFDGGRFTLHEIIDEFVRPFDLSSKSLFRCGLVQNGQFDLLMVDVHHIIADGVSLDILVRDFKRLYLEKDLPQLELKYVDYAYWINSVQQNIEYQREFWATKLSGKLPKLGLSVGQKKQETNTYIVSTKTLRIEGELYQQLKQFTASANVSDFMFLLSAQYILLSRLSGCPDVVIGTDVVGRTEPMLQNIVGTFVNVLPLRIQVDAGDSYLEFLEKVKQCVLEAFEHQDFQFDQMVSMVNDGKDKPENPVVEFHFSFTNTIDDREKLDLFEFFPVPNKRDEIAQYELQLEATEGPGSLDVLFVYSRELYDNGTIDTLMTYYLNIIKFVLHNSASPIDAIDIEVKLATVS